MTTTVNLTCRNPRHDHDARVVSRWDDGRHGNWKPRPEFKPTHGEGYAIIWGPGDTHVSYNFPCGTKVTQERLHSLLDEARSLGKTEITLT